MHLFTSRLPVQDFRSFTSYLPAPYLNTVMAKSQTEVVDMTITSVLAINCRNPSEQTWRAWAGWVVWASCDPAQLPSPPCMFEMLADMKRRFQAEKLRVPPANMGHYVSYPDVNTFIAQHGDCYANAFGAGRVFISMLNHLRFGFDGKG